MDRPLPQRRQQRTSAPVARAMVSPSAMVAAGAAAGLSLVAGLPVIVAVGLGAGAWLVRVAVAIPSAVQSRRRRRPPAVDPFTVGEPWRAFVLGARQTSRRYSQAVATVPQGPLADRLATIGGRVHTAVADIGQIARSGHALTSARRRIDDHGLRRQLSNNPDPAVAGALQAQLDAAQRLDATIEATRARLEMIDAHLGQAVTRAVEIAATSDAGMTLGGVDSDLMALVDEMEALKQALDETGLPPGPALPPPGPA